MISAFSNFFFAARRLAHQSEQASASPVAGASVACWVVVGWFQTARWATI